jgi:uncharacterized protein (DUF2141 family)
MIKFYISILFSGLLPVPLVSFRPVINQNLKVTITRLHNNNGEVLVSLFKNEIGFPDNAAKAYGKEKGFIVEKTSTIIFKNVPPGTYAIAILHDENKNQKMDKTIFGLPIEGFGFSNNATAPFGPPSYKKASFIHTASGPTEIQVKTKYL